MYENTEVQWISILRLSVRFILNDFLGDLSASAL